MSKTNGDKSKNGKSKTHKSGANRGPDGKFLPGHDLGYPPGYCQNPDGMAGRRLADYIKQEIDSVGEEGFSCRGRAFAHRLLNLAMQDPSKKNAHMVGLHATAIRFLADRMWPKEDNHAPVLVQVNVENLIGQKVIEQLADAGNGKLAGRAAVQDALRGSIIKRHGTGPPSD